MNFKDLWFYGDLPLGTLRDLWLLIPHCQYIKTPSDYLKWLEDDEWPTPIKEEIIWWNRTLDGNPIEWDKGN